MASGRLELPISRLMVEWRDDAYRFLHADDADTDQEWTEPDVGGPFIWASLGEVRAGDRDEPTWWVMYGEAAGADTVAVWLADDRDVQVIRVPHLWIAEWRSLPQAAFIRRNSERFVRGARRPAFLPPARFRFDQSTIDPRG